MTRSGSKNGASFRDPSGFVFSREGVLLRQVNSSYQKEFDKLLSSGLYSELVEAGMLVGHEETSESPIEKDLSYKVIRPERIPFISYPYEWSFTQLKDAALLTLAVTKSALTKGMILKDASAYNIQFVDGRPILIDTLSFGIYKEGKPWEAYRQFCQHFLAPIALASLVDIRLTQLLRVHIDGIPLDLASTLLPQKTRLGLSGLALHIHMHAKAQKKFADDTTVGSTGINLSKTALLNLLNGLEKTVASLNWVPQGTEWGNYYNVTNYNDEALRRKGELVGSMIERVRPQTVWDLGANNGLFSREASRRGIETIASDIDPAAVEKDFLAIKQYGEKHLLPLVIDLTNPSASIGWANNERDSLLARGPVDLVMALALIHHLAISNNVPLEMVAEFLADAGNWAIVEFVPKTDSQVQRLLATRKDIFPHYDEAGFEKSFGSTFKLVEKTPIQESERTLYLLKKK